MFRRVKLAGAHGAFIPVNIVGQELRVNRVESEGVVNSVSLSE